MLVYDLIRREWYPPIVGWNVSNWAINGSDLVWADSYTPNVWRMSSDRTDDGLGFVSLFRTWQESFGDAVKLKSADLCFVEYNGNTNADMKFTVLYDDDGYTGKTQITVLASETNFIYNSATLNTFGASVFATEIFGTNVAAANLKKRRVYFDLKSDKEFHILALEGGSEKEGANYEFVRWGVRLAEIGLEPLLKLKKAIV